MDLPNIVIQIIISIIGIAVFTYGKKQREFMPMFVGIMLMGIPYVIDDNTVLIVTSIGALIFPWFYNRFLR